MGNTLYAVVAGAYGILVGTMGMYGYVKAKSVPSVVAGEIGFVLCAIAAGLIWVKKPAGLYLAVGTTALLLIVFGIRFAKTRNFMPAGLMLAFSVLACATLLTGLL